MTIIQTGIIASHFSTTTPTKLSNMYTFTTIISIVLSLSEHLSSDISLTFLSVSRYLIVLCQGHIYLKGMHPNQSKGYIIALITGLSVRWREWLVFDAVSMHEKWLVCLFTCTHTYTLSLSTSINPQWRWEYVSLPYASGMCLCVHQRCDLYVVYTHIHTSSPFPFPIYHYQSSVVVEIFVSLPYASGMCLCVCQHCDS